MPGAGSSNETFLFRLDRCEGGNTVSQNLVIRWKPKGFLVFPEDSYDMQQQFRLQSCLADTPVPAPPVYWLEEDPAVIGAPFYIMERVDGWIPGDFPPYHIEGKLFEASEADRAKTWLGVVDTMIKIHTLDWRAAGLEFLGVPQGKDFIKNQVAFWDRVFQQNNEPMPAVLATTREWLLENSFTPNHLSLTWGDARLGNMIFRDYDVVAALDWEMACIGDPESDLAWFAHVDWASSAGRPSSPLPRLAGLPSIEETLAYYERATGRKVENFHYYDVFATWRLALVYTRIEQDEKYLARSGNRKGFLTWTHDEKLKRLLGI
jgi:aminoglycoside phosphotransferase (APT) family kinase protein